LTRLDIDNPLIVTDAALVKSGTVELALAHWASASTNFRPGAAGPGNRHRRRLHARLPRGRA
jgi:hypothetical protein